MPRLYLAHPVSLYGTPLKARLVATLEHNGWTVEDPDTPEHQAAYAERGMAHFLGVVATCDALGWIPFSGDWVGAGVAREVLEAVVSGIPVYKIRPGEFRYSPEAAPRIASNTGPKPGDREDGGPHMDRVLTIEETRARVRYYGGKTDA